MKGEEDESKIKKEEKLFQTNKLLSSSSSAIIFVQTAIATATIFTTHL